jgi:hypothetical protein
MFPCHLHVSANLVANVTSMMTMLSSRGELFYLPSRVWNFIDGKYQELLGLFLP